MGDQRQVRQPLPAERVDETIDYEIDDSQAKRLGLTPTGDVDVLQHIELPDSPVLVTEHRLAVYQAVDGSLYVPDVPNGTVQEQASVAVGLSKLFTGDSNGRWYGTRAV